MPLRVASPSPYAPSIGFSAAVRTGEWVFVAGTTAVGRDGDVVGDDDPYAQAVEVLRKITAALAEVDATPADVVRTRIYLTRTEDWESVGRAHGEVFAEAAPAATMVVTGLLDPRMLVEIEAVAHTG